MMRQFSTGELAKLQTTQESAMQDTCYPLTYTPGSSDDYGWPAKNYVVGSTAYACGLDPSAQEEGMDDTEVSMIDAKLRLPLSAEAAFTAVDRVRITKRFGVTISPAQDYDIVSGPERGPSGLVLNLKRVTDG